MSFETWLVFVLSEAALSAAPGPAVFYVVSRSLRGGMRATLPAAAGIVSGNAIYFALSATSLGALIAASAAFFSAVKWLGAAYLFYLGAKALRAAPQATAVDLTAHGGEAASSRRSTYLGAITLQLANPKALLFFIALLPQFIDPSQPVPAQMVVLAVSSMVPEFFILLGYGWLAHRTVQRAQGLAVRTRLAQWLAGAEGAGLIACSALVLSLRKS